MSPYGFLAAIIAIDVAVVLLALYTSNGGRVMAVLILAGVLSAVLWPERF